MAGGPHSRQVARYNDADRNGDVFDTFIKQWLAAVGRDISNLDGISQAAEVARLKLHLN